MNAERKIRAITLAATTTTAFLTTFTASAVNIALPVIGTRFGMGAIGLSWIAASYLLVSAVLLIPFGRIADIYGRKHIFLYGLILYSLSSVVAAAAPSAALLIFSRALQGAGAAMLLATSLPLLLAVFPFQERGKVLGINVAAVYLGLSFGPFIGGCMVSLFGWRSIFALNAGLGFAVAAFILLNLEEKGRARGEERFDLAGALIYGAGLAALMYGFSLLPGARGLWLSLLGAALLAVFFAWENITKTPLLDTGLFLKNRVFALSNIAALVNYSATFSVSFLLSLYLQYLKGFGAREAGAVLAVQPVIQAVFSPFAGKLSDRREPRVVASTGMALTAAGLLLLFSFDGGTPLWFIVGSLAVLGLGFALFSSPNTNAVMSSIGDRSHGVASGTLGTMRLTGQMLSMAIVMFMLSLYTRGAPITPAVHPLFLQAMKTAFGVSALLCVLGIFASLVRGKVH
ncbi:MAG: MFS transporter [Endomicrobiales bacterium]